MDVTTTFPHGTLPPTSHRLVDSITGHLVTSPRTLYIWVGHPVWRLTNFFSSPKGSPYFYPAGRTGIDGWVALGPALFPKHKFLKSQVFICIERVPATAFYQFFSAPYLITTHKRTFRLPVGPVWGPSRVPLCGNPKSPKLSSACWPLLATFFADSHRLFCQFLTLAPNRGGPRLFLTDPLRAILARSSLSGGFPPTVFVNPLCRFFFSVHLAHLKTPFNPFFLFLFYPPFVVFVSHWRQRLSKVNLRRCVFPFFLQLCNVVLVFHFL